VEGGGTVGNPERTWGIGDLAAEFDVTPRTIRFYEEHQLLSPERRGTQRVFRDGDRVRLSLVLRGKRLGMPLQEIKKIIGMYDAEPGEVGQLRYLLQQIADRRAQLEQRRRDIDQTLAEMDEIERRCIADLHTLEASTADAHRP
jgi:DNA-binding transcriptional MerR regulator